MAACRFGWAAKIAGALLLWVAVSGCGGSPSSGFTPTERGGVDAGAIADATAGDDSAPLFTPNPVGSFGGGGAPVSSDGGGHAQPKDCDPSCAAAGGTCSAGACSIRENPGGVDAATQAQLSAGGPADSTFKWLYPYDRTVFAHGIVSPTLQFAGSGEALLVRITSTSLDYTGYFKPAQSALNVALSQKAWQAVAAAVLGSDTVKVAVTKIAGGRAAGPISEAWTIAQGNLHGTIYHETYNSPLAGAVGIMRIQLGDSQPTVLKSGCATSVIRRAPTAPPWSPTRRSPRAPATI